MRKIILTCFLFVFVFSTGLLAQTGRVTYNFNYDWKVWVGDDPLARDAGYNDTEWEKVSLPHAWNEDEAFRKDIRELSTGIAWYRKRFKLPGEYQDNKVFIEFEGVRQAAEVFVNGVRIGLHENGVTPFGFDISEQINFTGENVIAVRTDNDWDYRERSTGTEFQWNDRNFNANYGGITKNVILHVTGRVYQTLPLYTGLGTTGQYIYAKEFRINNKTAVICAESQVKNELGEKVDVGYEVEIMDAEGLLLKRLTGENESLMPGETKILSLTGEISGLNFWSWGYGYLYTVHTILKQNGVETDRVSTRTGFRKTEFGNGLIKLNDRVLMVKGYAQRTSNEWPALGMSVPPWMSDYSNHMMVKGNANLVRWMHITPWKQDVESCDRVGLMQAMPAGDAERDAEGRKWEQRVEVMRDAIIYNRNNPSILFYECGNNDISEVHMQEMKAVRDEFDPNGGRAIGSRNMLDSRAAEYGGEMLYINKSKEKPVWAMEYMRDEALRKYWDEYTPPFHRNGEGPLYKGQDASAYNRNQDSYAIEAVRRWYDYFRERPGTGDRVSSGGVNIIFSDSNTHHRGEENYRRSGEVDPLRIPKDAFFAHRVMWDGWVDVEKHRTHIVGHWNYGSGTVKNVIVVSSGERVDLFLNGRSMGSGTRSLGFLYTFENIPWEEGILEAVSFDREGEFLSSAELKTTGSPFAVKLSYLGPDSALWADGADVALIQVEVVDREGRRCPTAFNQIDFELFGEADWLGGMAQGPGNYILEHSLPVECGINRVLVRSTGKAGMIRIKAGSGGLITSSLSFESKPVFVQDGLSLHFPSAYLPVNLERGPSPSSPSFHITRESVPIIRAVAGSNQELAAESFDGSQSTRWVSDGEIENGWIEYFFDGLREIDEIALKLSGWRTRSYPVEITSGDSLIYRGLTSPNLGFFYVPLKRTLYTDRMKIRLYDQSEFDEKYKLVEITGKLDKETANDLEVNNARNLNIVEVGLFKKLE